MEPATEIGISRTISRASVLFAAFLAITPRLEAQRISEPVMGGMITAGVAGGFMGTSRASGWPVVPATQLVVSALIEGTSSPER